MRTSIEAAIAIATDGHQPDERDVPAPRLDDARLRQLRQAPAPDRPAPPGGLSGASGESSSIARVGVAGGSRQIRRGSNDQVASRVRTTTAANDNRPAPVLTLASGPKRTVAASRTTT